MLTSAMSDALVLYDDAELATIIGDAVVSRHTVAERPMSWTQKVVFAGAGTFAYKAMVPPLVEAEFYQMTATLAGDGAGHPAVEHSGAVSSATQDAIAEILTAAGYTVIKDFSDLAPYQLKVTGHTPREPSWRDWLEKRQDELTETMKATYRREHPGGTR